MFGKWDFVRTFLADPCDAPFSAYALAMGGAALESFVLLNQLDLSDIFWEGLQTGTGKMRRRSARKGIKGKKSTRFAWAKNVGKAASFDPHQQIGRFIGKFSPLAKVPMPPLIGALWLIFNVLELINFVIFLAEVVAQFFFRWTSLIMNSQYCDAKNDGILLATNDGYVTGAIFGRTALLAGTIEKQRAPIGYVGSIVTIPAGWSGVVTASFSWEEIGELPTNSVTLYIEKLGLGGRTEVREYGGSPGEVVPAGIRWDVSNGGSFQITTFVDQGFVQMRDVVIYGQCSKN